MLKYQNYCAHVYATWRTVSTSGISKPGILQQIDVGCSKAAEDFASLAAVGVCTVAAATVTVTNEIGH